MGAIKIEKNFFLLLHKEKTGLLFKQVIKVELNKFFPVFVFIELLVLYLFNIDFLLMQHAK